jgi:transposase
MKHPMDEARKLFFEQTGKTLRDWQALSYEQKYRWIAQIDGLVSFKSTAPETLLKYETREDRNKEIKARLARGESVRKVANHFGLSLSGISRIVNNKESKRKPRKKYKKRESPTKKRNEEMLAMYDTGATWQQIAAHFEINSWTYVRDLLNAMTKARREANKQ